MYLAAAVNDGYGPAAGGSGCLRPPRGTHSGATSTESVPETVDVYLPGLRMPPVTGRRPLLQREKGRRLPRTAVVPTRWERPAQSLLHVSSAAYRACSDEESEADR